MANAVCPASVVTTPPAIPRMGPATVWLAGRAPTAPSVRAGLCGGVRVCAERRAEGQRLLFPCCGRKSLCTHLDSVTYVNNANRSIAGVPYTPAPVPRAQGTPTLLHRRLGRALLDQARGGGGPQAWFWARAFIPSALFNLYLFVCGFLPP